MGLSRVIAAIAAALCCVPLAWSQAKPSAVQTCQLGDLKLESGEAIRDFRMTYITFGTLNEKKSNAILSIHGLQGNRNSQSVLGRARQGFRSRPPLHHSARHPRRRVDGRERDDVADALRTEHEVSPLQHPRHGQRRIPHADGVSRFQASACRGGQLHGRHRDDAVGGQLSRLHGSGDRGTPMARENRQGISSGRPCVRS